MSIQIRTVNVELNHRHYIYIAQTLKTCHEQVDILRENPESFREICEIFAEDLARTQSGKCTGFKWEDFMHWIFGEKVFSWFIGKYPKCYSYHKKG